MSLQSDGWQKKRVDYSVTNTEKGQQEHHTRTLTSTLCVLTCDTIITHVLWQIPLLTSAPRWRLPSSCKHAPSSSGLRPSLQSCCSSKLSSTQCGPAACRVRPLPPVSPIIKFTATIYAPVLFNQHRSSVAETTKKVEKWEIYRNL